MRIEIKAGSKLGTPLMVVCFEESSNYDPEKHEWVPRIEEVALINETLKLLTKKEELKLSKQNS